MQKEYTPSTGITILYGLTAIAMLVFSVYLLTIYKPGVSYFVLLFPLALITGAVLIAVNLGKRRVVIDANGILCISLFSTRRLDFTNIKGCRIGQKRIRLKPLSDNDRTVIIGNYSDLRNADELATWIKSRFQDLDAIDLANHRQELAKDTRLGATEAERQKYLAKAKDLAIVYNVWGLIAGIALGFIKGVVASGLLMACPFLGIGLMLSSRGTIKFVSSSTVSAYPFVLLGMAIPCFMVLMKSLIEYTLFQYSHLWLPALGISTIFFVSLYIPGVNKSVLTIRAQILTMLIPSLLYGFGSATLINCALDPNKPVVYPATVLGSQIQHDRGDTYYLDLSPWGPRKDEQQVKVKRDLYHAVAEGDSVNVNLRPGLLHIPWYTVSRLPLTH